VDRTECSSKPGSDSPADGDTVGKEVEVDPWGSRSN